jgi:hypothetical protein
MKQMALKLATLAVTLLLVTCIVSVKAKDTCFNYIVDFDADKKGLRFELGREELMPVSHSDKYQCETLEAISKQPTFPSPTILHYNIIYMMMAQPRGYFAQLEKKGCSGSDGRDYCCDAGLKSFNLTNAYICEQTIAENNKGNSTRKAKMAVTLDYSCNQEARRKSVAFRVNTILKTACVTPK